MVYNFPQNENVIYPSVWGTESNGECVTCMQYAFLHIYTSKYIYTLKYIYIYTLKYIGN